MKKFSKILSVALLVALVLSLGVANAFADPTNTTITIPSGDDHTYAVYQIFTGELADGKLSNVHWGKNGTGTEGEVVAKETLDTIAAITGTDEEKAEALSAYAVLTGEPAYTVSKTAAVTVPTGYYLIRDLNAAELGAGDEATLYIVQVVGPTEITRKAGTTTSDKTVDDKNDSDPNTATLNAKNTTSSDYDIGDPVPYHLTATISEKVGQYDTYYIVLKDTLEAGKFSNISALTIKINDKEIADTDDYTVVTTTTAEPSKDGFEIRYDFTPKANKTLDSLKNAVITVDFTATLGEGAAIGSAGNRNTFEVKYSNNPNTQQEGSTTPTTVITFTYKVVVNKVDENGQALEGAQFALYKVPSSYTLPTTGDAKSKGENAQAAAIATPTVVVSGEKNDVFTIKGLDDGRYVLVETTTPTGYNTIDPQVFDIVATHEGLELKTLNGNKVSGTIEFTRNTENEDALEATIMNQSGTQLPSTGGIGTTIFYVVGGVLVLAAIILLVTKKRMSE